MRIEQAMYKKSKIREINKYIDELLADSSKAIHVDTLSEVRYVRKIANFRGLAIISIKLDYGGWNLQLKKSS